MRGILWWALSLIIVSTVTLAVPIVAVVTIAAPLELLDHLYTITAQGKLLFVTGYLSGIVGLVLIWKLPRSLLQASESQQVSES